MKNKVAIVSGEPFSVNSEIIGKSWKKIRKKYKKKIFIIGNYLLIKNQFKKLQINLPLEKINTVNSTPNSKNLKILNTTTNSKSSYWLVCIILRNSRLRKKLMIRLRLYNNLNLIYYLQSTALILP